MSEAGNREVASLAVGDDRDLGPNDSGRGPRLQIMELATIDVDSDGRVAYVSPAARQRLGLRMGDLVGAAIVDLATSEHRLVLQQWLTAMDGGGVPTERELRFVISGRSGGAAAATASVERDRIVIDLESVQVESSRRGVIEQLRTRVESLDRANSDLVGFTYSAAHDLRSPLASVAAAADALVRSIGERATAHEQELLAMVLYGVGHMTAVIDAVLACSVAGTRLQLEEFDGDDVVAAAICRMREPAQAAGARIRTSPIGAVFGDRDQLLVVFVNLLENAIKYRSEDRALCIDIGVDDNVGHRVFRVADTGRGIPVSDCERVFRMFERVDGTESGTGIGLATCRRVVEAHGGQIAAVGNTAGGTTVSFSLPSQPRTT